MTEPVPLPQLRAELLRRSQADQDARFAYLDARDRGEDADWAPVHAVDGDNLAFLIDALGEYGWLGSDLVGADGAHACWLLVQHAPAEYQDRWLPLMEHAVAAGTASASDLVYLQDRVNLHHNRPQTHGSQSWGTHHDPPRLWPVTDPTNLNRRRAEVGLPPLTEATIADAWTADELRDLGYEIISGTGPAKDQTAPESST